MNARMRSHINAALVGKALEQLVSTVQGQAETLSGRVQDKLPDFPLSFPTPVVRWTESAVRQEGENLVLRVGLPGFSPDDLELSVEREGDVDVLVIEASNDNTEDKDDTKRFAAVWERNFRQVLDLPEGVEKDSISADMKNGLLTITIPQPAKGKEEETSRKIRVNLS